MSRGDQLNKEKAERETKRPRNVDKEKRDGVRWKEEDRGY